MAAGSVNAFQVGSYFVSQYYQVLQRQPDLAHQFYSDASSMIRVDGNSSETASSLPQIHSLILSLNFTGIEIKTINSLDSWSGGLLVMISGSVKPDSTARRNFVQSFFLGPQNKGFFVLNDIFQFIDEVMVPQEQSPLLSENNFHYQLNGSGSLPPQEVPDYVLEEDARQYTNSVHVEEDKYSLPEEHHYQEPVVETPQEETSYIPRAFNVAENHISNAFEEPIVEAPVKKTWASILRVPGGQSTPLVPNHHPQHKTSPAATGWDHMLPQPSNQQSNSEVSYFQESGVEDAVVNLSLEDEELKSVYVRNLPSYVTSADLEQEFENFGKIKHDGIFIRNKEELGVCYAFVEYEDVLGVQNAIKASPIRLGGRQVYIEERRANASSTSRGRGRGRGRGGFNTEASRGRTGGRGWSSNQDSIDYGRPRGSGYQLRSQGY